MTSIANSLVRLKLCLAGDFGVGKTSLIRRFVQNKFNEKYLTTIGALISKKRLGVISGYMVDLIIWDLKGSSQPDTTPRNYVRSAKGALLVADLTRPATIEGVEEWHAFITEMTGPIPMVLAGNKADLIDTSADTGDHTRASATGRLDTAPAADLRGEPFDLLEACGADLGAPVVVTSAKTGQNVERVFQSLGRRMIEAAELQRPVQSAHQ